MAFFSIITPVYNVEGYLEQCVESALNQSMGDFELILVDDGSTDSSGHICDRFAASDKRVKVLHQKNSGHIAARMNGVAAAKGDYILFADSDDYWLPDAFLKIESAIKKHGCDALVYCYSDKGKPNGFNFFGGERAELLLSDYLLTNLRCSGLNALYAKAVSRELFAEINISAFSSFKNAEDMLLSLEFLKRASKISYLPESLYFHRLDNPDSIVNNYNEAALEEFLASRRALMAELERLGCANDEAQNEFYYAFLFCAANAALQISKQIKFTKAERKSQYKKIADMPFFLQAANSGAAKRLGRVKRVRIGLLKKKMFNLLYSFDRLRILANG